MNELLRTTLLSVITTAVPILTIVVIMYISKFFSIVSKKTESSEFKETIDSTMQLILDVVSTTSQTYVDALKASGDFTAEAQLMAFNITKERVMNLLSERAVFVIQTLYGDVEEWVDVQIESAVRKTKNTTLPLIGEGIIIEEGEE